MVAAVVAGFVFHCRAFASYTKNRRCLRTYLPTSLEHRTTYFWRNCWWFQRVCVADATLDRHRLHHLEASSEELEQQLSANRRLIDALQSSFTDRCVLNRATQGAGVRAGLRSTLFSLMTLVLASLCSGSVGVVLKSVSALDTAFAKLAK